MNLNVRKTAALQEKMQELQKGLDLFRMLDLECEISSEEIGPATKGLLLIELNELYKKAKKAERAERRFNRAFRAMPRVLRDSYKEVYGY